MSVSVDMIKTGYSFPIKCVAKSDVMKANCTCTLIKEKDLIIVIDTLTAWDGSFLTQELKNRNIELLDVTHVIGTHGHSDHIGNLNLFTNALHIVGQSISRRDEYLLHSFEEEPYKLSENIEIIATPGHTLSDVSVLARNTDLGTVAVVGDLFEREDDISNPDLWKITAGSENPELQFENRKKILKLVDYIIPGHGPGFKVTKELISIHEVQE